MNLKPLGDRIILEPIAVEQVVGGIYLPDSAKEKPKEFNVLALGTGGPGIDFHVAVGDVVLLSQYSGQDVKLGGNEYKLCKQEDILARIKGK